MPLSLTISVTPMPALRARGISSASFAEASRLASIALVRRLPARAMRAAISSRSIAGTLVVRPERVQYFMQYCISIGSCGACRAKESARRARERPPGHGHGREAFHAEPDLTLGRRISREHIALGRAVRELRARRGLSQEQLGFRSDLHRNHVGAIERGEINPTFRVLLKLEQGLQLPLRATRARVAARSRLPNRRAVGACAMNTVRRCCCLDTNAPAARPAEPRRERLACWRKHPDSSNPPTFTRSGEVFAMRSTHARFRRFAGSMTHDSQFQGCRNRAFDLSPKSGVKRSKGGVVRIFRGVERRIPGLKITPGIEDGGVCGGGLIPTTGYGRQSGIPLGRQAMQFALSDEELHRLAEALAPILAQRLGHREKTPASEGYLTPDAAARYLGVSRKRIYDLTSMRALVPDGRDGRTPLFTRATLDAYVRRATVGRAPTGASR